jgi:hypothetical protein
MDVASVLMNFHSLGQSKVNVVGGESINGMEVIPPKQNASRKKRRNEPGLWGTSSLRPFLLQNLQLLSYIYVGPYLGLPNLACRECIRTDFIYYPKVGFTMIMVNPR